jgi:hypothetical protein
LISSTFRIQQLVEIVAKIRIITFTAISYAESYMIFPEQVFGKPETNWIYQFGGGQYDPICGG